MFAADYSRVSTDEQAKEGFSLEAQQEFTKKYIRDEGWDYYGSFTDPGVSGKDLKRPGVQDMLRAVREGRIQAVVVHKLDRLTRNIGDLHDLMMLFEKQNVKLVSVTEKIDTSTAMGRMFVYMLGLFAQWFRENLSEEVMKGMKKRAEKGFRNGSVAPFGYDLEDGRLVIDPEQAEWVKRIFDLYTRDKLGFEKIAQHMNREGILTNRGSRDWSKNFIQYMLMNPVYIGKLRWRPKEGQEILRDSDHPPIIDEVTFKKAQSMMQRRSNGEVPATSRRHYPFSGLIHCGECGKQYFGRLGSSKAGPTFHYRCYGKRLGHCNARDISEVKFEQLLFEYMNFQMEEVDEPVVQDKSHEKERKRIERELAKSETRRKNWQYAFGDGKLPYQDYVQLIDEEAERVRQLETELAQLPEDQSLSKEVINNTARFIMDNWNYFDADTKKDAAQSLYRTITIQFDEASNRWTVTKMMVVTPN